MITATLHQILFGGGDNKKNHMGKSRSTYGREESCLHGFGGYTLRKDETWKT